MSADAQDLSGDLVAARRSELHPEPINGTGSRTMPGVGEHEAVEDGGTGGRPQAADAPALSRAREQSAETALAAMEAEMAALWQLRKARARDLVHLLHPRLDPTALPLIGALGTLGAMRPSDLVRQLHLEPSTISRQIAAVERLGLVSRVPDPSDARARLVDLTPSAREQFTTYRDQQLQQWRRSLHGWPAGDVEELTRLLRRLRDGG